MFILELKDYLVNKSRLKVLVKGKTINFPILAKYLVVVVDLLL